VYNLKKHENNLKKHENNLKKSCVKNQLEMFTIKKQLSQENIEGKKINDRF